MPTLKGLMFEISREQRQRELSDVKGIIQTWGVTLNFSCVYLLNI